MDRTIIRIQEMGTSRGPPKQVRATLAASLLASANPDYEWYNLTPGHQIRTDLRGLLEWA